MEEYDKAIELDPELAMAYNNRGTIFLNRGESARAIEEFSKAMELDPEFAMAFHNQGLALLEMGDPKQAGWHFLSACGMGYAFSCKKLEDLGGFEVEM
jgi:tetratricopeptide (TPR) repeat protein